jgi:hypothetical protein
VGDRLIVLAAIIAAVIVVTVLARAALRRRHAIPSIELSDLGDVAGDGAVVVVFSSPLCHGCAEWRRALDAASIPSTSIDIVANARAANRYRIKTTPHVAVVDSADGAVLREFEHYTPRAGDLASIARLVASH